MSPTRLVVSITGPDATSAMAQAREAEALGADLLEIRLDLLESVEAALKVLKGRTAGVIATCRRAAEGGGFRGEASLRRRLLEGLIRSGAEWVDLEPDVLGWRPRGARLIGSIHDREGIPSEAAVRSLLAKGGVEVAKAVGAPRSLREARALMDLNALAPGRVAAFGMGPRGIPTRVLAGRAGAWGVYAAPDFGPEAAPGQIPVSELLFAYRFREIGSKTLLYGLLGSPVDRSPGPWAHTAALRASGADAVYLPLDALDAEDARWALAGFDLAGASVTRPFKEALLGMAETLEEEARKAGALNTLFRSSDESRRGWMGANTDAAGLRKLLGRRRPASVAVIGAGGLARAALAAFRRPGCRLGLLSRRPAEGLGADAITAKDLKDFEVLVQATPAGGPEDPEALPVPPEALRKGALLIEAHVHPLETLLTREARKRGLDVRTGLELWLAQAREQFVIWREREPVGAVLLGAAMARLIPADRGTVALTGMRGSGKSTVGRLLAERLSLVFRDLDLELARAEGKPASEILREDGEEAFRLAETRALARQRFLPPAVLALGGGTVTREENRRLLQSFARTVFLDLPVAVLKKRLGKDPGGRPSLTGQGVAQEVGGLLKAREADYRAAAGWTVDADAEPETVARRVAAALGMARQEKP